MSEFPFLCIICGAWFEKPSVPEATRVGCCDAVSCHLEIMANVVWNEKMSMVYEALRRSEMLPW